MGYGRHDHRPRPLVHRDALGRRGGERRDRGGVSEGGVGFGVVLDTPGFEGMVTI